MDSNDACIWKESFAFEFQSPNKNKTWELIPLPHGWKDISSQRVSTVKETAEDLIERYKARLVAKGF